MCWSMILQSYSYVVKVIKGSENHAADYLRRTSFHLSMKYLNYQIYSFKREVMLRNKLIPIKKFIRCQVI